MDKQENVIVETDDDGDAGLCPSCGRWVPGQHELGVLYDPKPDGCGFCSHASMEQRTAPQGGINGWLTCGICGRSYDQRVVDGHRVEFVEIPPRFFDMDNHGVSYSFVARDLEHCKAILAGVATAMYDAQDIEFEARTVADVDRADCEWRELTLEQAAMKFTICDGGPGPHRAPLSERMLGDYFCSEY